MKEFLSRYKGYKAEALLVAVLAAGLAASFVLRATLHDPRLDRLVDNCHWTLEMLVGAGVIAYRRRRATGDDRRTLGWFLAGAVGYLCGQLLWDFGAATGTLSFSGFYDFFYLSLPVCVGLGLLPVLTRRAEGKRRHAVWVNLTGIAALTVTLTLVLYLPVRGSSRLGELALLAAYPVLFFTAFGIGLLAVVARRLAARPALFLLLGGLAALGLTWLQWNLHFLRGDSQGGPAIDSMFSIARVAATIGLARWREETAPPGAYHRWLGHGYRLLPLLLVLATGLGVLYGQHQLGPAAEVIVNGGALIVIVCAIVRQTLLLYEQEQALLTEQRLRERESHLQAIFDNGSDLVFGVAVGADGTLRYTTINPAGAALAGIDPARFVGSTPAEYFPADRAAFFEANYRRCIAAGRTIQYEQPARAVTGPVIFETTLVPVRDGAGRIAQLMGVSRNVTAQRTTLEAMRNLNAQLEAKIGERTRELQAAYRELEMFSYSVSHDLRSPLRGISGFCATLIEDHAAGLPAAARAALDRIRVASARMGQIIDDLLQLSRISRGALRLQEVDLSAIVARLAEELRAAAPSRRAEFVITPGLTACCDLRLTQNVLENLLNNAWKYTSRHAAARIEFTAVEIDGETVFVMRDDGAGFEMLFVEKLFQNFQRLHDETEFEGTGVGLAIVGRIVRRHGGRVWAEGAVEKGASFYFTLGPKAEIPPPAAP